MCPDPQSSLATKGQGNKFLVVKEHQPVGSDTQGQQLGGHLPVLASV